MRRGHRKRRRNINEVSKPEDKTLNKDDIDVLLTRKDLLDNLTLKELTAVFRNKNLTLKQRQTLIDSIPEKRIGTLQAYMNNANTYDVIGEIYFLKKLKKVKELKNASPIDYKELAVVLKELDLLFKEVNIDKIKLDKIKYFLSSHLELFESYISILSEEELNIKLSKGGDLARCLELLRNDKWDGQNKIHDAIIKNSQISFAKRMREFIFNVSVKYGSAEDQKKLKFFQEKAQDVKQWNEATAIAAFNMFCWGVHNTIKLDDSFGTKNDIFNSFITEFNNYHNEKDYPFFFEEDKKDFSKIDQKLKDERDKKLSKYGIVSTDNFNAMFSSINNLRDIEKELSNSGLLSEVFSRVAKDKESLKKLLKNQKFQELIPSIANYELLLAKFADIGLVEKIVELLDDDAKGDTLIVLERLIRGVVGTRLLAEGDKDFVTRIKTEVKKLNVLGVKKDYVLIEIGCQNISKDNKYKDEKEEAEGLALRMNSMFPDLVKIDQEKRNIIMIPADRAKDVLEQFLPRKYKSSYYLKEKFNKQDTLFVDSKKLVGESTFGDIIKHQVLGVFGIIPGTTYYVGKFLGGTIPDNIPFVGGLSLTQIPVIGNAFGFVSNMLLYTSNAFRSIHDPHHKENEESIEENRIKAEESMSLEGKVGWKKVFPVVNAVVYGVFGLFSHVGRACCKVVGSGISGAGDWVKKASKNAPGFGTIGRGVGAILKGVGNIFNWCGDILNMPVPYRKKIDWFDDRVNSDIRGKLITDGTDYNRRKTIEVVHEDNIKNPPIKNLPVDDIQKEKYKVFLNFKNPQFIGYDDGHYIITAKKDLAADGLWGWNVVEICGYNKSGELCTKRVFQTSSGDLVSPFEDGYCGALSSECSKFAKGDQFKSMKLDPVVESRGVSINKVNEILKIHKSQAVDEKLNCGLAGSEKLAKDDDHLSDTKTYKVGNEYIFQVSDNKHLKIFYANNGKEVVADEAKIDMSLVKTINDFLNDKIKAKLIDDRNPCIVLRPTFGCSLRALSKDKDVTGSTSLDLSVGRASV